MECKCKQSITGLWLYLELIDTLWNVNDSVAAVVERLKIELIDTLWNVNAVIVIFSTLAIRINRYIMECKY